MRLKLGDDLEGYRLGEFADKKVVFTKDAARVEFCWTISGKSMLRLRQRRRPVRSLPQDLFQDLLLRRGFCQTCRAATESQFLGVQLPIRD